MGVQIYLADMKVVILLGAVVMAVVSENLTIEEIERQAFAVCDKDRMVGLTWNEVASCEERLGQQLIDMNITLPTEEDFNNSDTNSDGVLLFEEWKAWAYNMNTITEEDIDTI